MKRSLCVVALVLMTGCIPAIIKQELSFIDTIAQVGVFESKGYEDLPEVKAKLEIGTKAVNSLNRLAKHSAVVQAWLSGKKVEDSQ